MRREKLAGIQQVFWLTESKTNAYMGSKTITCLTLKGLSSSSNHQSWQQTLGTHCQFTVLTDDREDEEMIQTRGIDFEEQGNCASHCLLLS